LMLASTVQFSRYGRDSGPGVAACPVPAWSGHRVVR